MILRSPLYCYLLLLFCHLLFDITVYRTFAFSAIRIVSTSCYLSLNIFWSINNFLISSCDLIRQRNGGFIAFSNATQNCVSLSCNQLAWIINTAGLCSVPYYSTFIQKRHVASVLKFNNRIKKLAFFSPQVSAKYYLYYQISAWKFIAYFILLFFLKLNQWQT